MKTRVIKEFRHGLLVVRVRRVRSSASARHTLSIHRLYKNGDIWHESSRFGPNDIPLIRYLLDEAHTWILTRNQSHSEDENQ
jgi:hypothetical protein